MSWLLYRSDRTYLVDSGERLETDLGIIEVPTEPEVGATLKSHLGEPFLVLHPRPTDLFEQLDRSGAPMLPRDIGLLVGRTGITAGDHVLDVGTGTGILAITLAHLGVEVTTVERSDGAAELARENLDAAGVTDRVTLLTGEATERKLPGPFDAMTLDTGDAATLAERAASLLRPGGVIGAYCPFVEDARQVVTALRETGMREVRTIEPFHRRMDFGERGSRPATAPVGHTGYLTTARYLPVEPND